MRMILIRDGSWCAEDGNGKGVSEEAKLQALATICLSLESYNCSLVEDAATAKEVWKKVFTRRYRSRSSLPSLYRPWFPNLILILQQMSESVDSNENSKSGVVAKPRLLTGQNVENSPEPKELQHSDEDTSADSDMVIDFFGWNISEDEMANKSVQKELTSHEKVPEYTCGLKSDDSELQRQSRYLHEKT